MPARKRKRRQTTSANPGAPHAGVPPALVDRHGRPVAPWKWRTFPVYFALSLGLFAGFYFGLFARAFKGTSPRVEEVGSFAVAILFSFALSQVVTRPAAAWALRKRLAARGERRN